MTNDGLATSPQQLLTRQKPVFVDGVPEPYRHSLVERAKDGDSDAFARLYDFYVERVFGYMYFHVSDEHAADDLTARVFLKAWKNIRCYEPGQPPFGIWLYVIARQSMLEYLKEQHTEPSVKEIISPADGGMEIYGGFLPCGDSELLNSSTDD